MTSSSGSILASAVSLFLLLHLQLPTALCYTCCDLRGLHGRTAAIHTSAFSAMTDRDAMAMDVAEFEQFDLTDLPDAMVDSTVWVGNLNEFVTDHELGLLFAQEGATSLLRLPAAIARRPNNDSLRYGAVHFPTSVEARAAVDKFDGFIYEGLPMKTQFFKDSKQVRAKVPEKLVSYVLGGKKNPFTGAPNKLRRISGDGVDRSGRRQPSKRKGSTDQPCRLSDRERLAFDRAIEYGFVTLESTGYRRGRKGSPLANAHRQWCDARGRPQIIVCKATGGRPQDNVIVDLSPLRIAPLGTGTKSLRRRASEILATAVRNGMVLNSDILEDNTVTIDSDAGVKEGHGCPSEDNLGVSAEAWTHEPLAALPAVSLGVFEGQRPNAKSMARELAAEWNVPDGAMGVNKIKKFHQTTRGKNGRGKNASPAKSGRDTRNKRHKVKRQKNVDFDFYTE